MTKILEAIKASEMLGWLHLDRATVKFDAKERDTLRNIMSFWDVFREHANTQEANLQQRHSALKEM